jgi:hypothetical protein
MLINNAKRIHNTLGIQTTNFPVILFTNSSYEMPPNAQRYAAWPGVEC